MRRIATLFGSLLLLLAVLPLAARAQSAPPIQGTFRYEAEGSDNIHQAIDAAVARMNFVTRPIARGRLRKTNEPYQAVTISQSNGQVSIITDARAPIVTPANGSPIKWRREDGEVFDVSTEWENGVLEQTFKAEDGQRINAFSVSADGSVLSMKVTVTSPKLSRPLVYTLKFRRT